MTTKQKSSTKTKNSRTKALDDAVKEASKAAIAIHKEALRELERH